MRLAIALQYIGTNYFGWQSQCNVIGIQTLLEKSLSKIAGTLVDVVGSSRTDKGVHAYFQVAHFDTNVQRLDINWVNGGNVFLPNDISILGVKEVSLDFHARFSAVNRTYRYVIYNSLIDSSFLNGLVFQYPGSLDIKSMDIASKCLVGEHDFSSFRGRYCQSRSPVRTINFCRIRKMLNFIVFDISGNSFLHRMVRNIVSGLLLVGSGRKSVDWFKEALTRKTMGYVPCVAPACGLYLYDIKYQNDYFNDIQRPYNFINIFD